ncbi:MAG: Ig-like domain-containing protein [Planctomycetota bacterium]|nr:Ig-like domain-containing protein [Planctomycetota bacterium]
MMRITLDSPALIAVRSWLADLGARQTQRSGRNGRRTASRLSFRGEQLEPRLMLDAGMRAVLPDLMKESDTGASFVDNFTSDRTPTLSGSVLGAASQVRLMIDGKPAAVIPVADGTWNYTVPAEAALAAGKHRFTVLPLDASGKAGKLSKPLSVTIETKAPAAATVILGALSDTGLKGDGETTYDTPTLRGLAPRGQWVNVAIDSVPAGRVKSDPKTGAWLLKAPQLASGVHDVTAVVESRSGIRSAATSFEIKISGKQTVMLDASEKNTVELTPSHLLGQESQGFIVTGVHRGTLQRWSTAQNKWVTFPPRRPPWDAAMLNAPPSNRTIAFNESVRWTPVSSDVGIGPAFDLIPLDRKAGLTASIPEAGTVPGEIRDPKIQFTAGVGTTISWKDPTDGCGCASTRYSIEVTREDGKTLLYSVPASVTQLSVPEGGRVLQAEMWGATKSGAGTKRSYDAVEAQLNKNRLAFNVASGLSALSVGEKARTQLAYSPSVVDGSKPSFALGGSHADLAYLEVSALPDAIEAAQGLLAETPILISSDSNKLTPAQKATLENNPILARNLFPGTVNGEVQPDQVRAHFQAGEMLRFAGNVDKSVRAGARIVVEEAQILVNNTLGPWFEKASLPVAADGGYSYDHVVPYGMTSVRVRLEYPTQAASVGLMAASAPVSASATSTPTVVSTAIDLSAYFNAFGITTAPFQAPNNQGFDRNGNYYNSDYTGPGTKDPVPGTSIVYQGIEFPIGMIPTEKGQVGGSGNSSKNNPPNFVQSKGQTIAVAPNLVADGASDYLYLAGAAVNGSQPSQTITLKFTDGSTDKWTQSFHDWASVGTPQPAPAPAPPTLLSPVLVATTANIDFEGEGLYGLQVIDGVLLAAGDRVLVKNQSGGETNGIYVASESYWSRAEDADTALELMNSATTVISGTINGGQYFVETTGTDSTSSFIQLGVTPILFYASTPPVPPTTPPHAVLPVLAATTAGLVALSGLQTIDGVALVAGDRVLVKNQGVGAAAVGAATDNGIYVASAGIWSRAKDADSGSEVQSAATTAASGTTNGGKYFIENSNSTSVTLGTTSISYEVSTPPVVAPRTFAGELLLKTEPERINQLGDLVTTPAHIFAYCYNLHGKQLASITLPPNENVGILSAVVAKAPAITVDEGIASIVLGTTNLTGVDVMALTIVNESNIGAGGGPVTFYFADQPEKGSVATSTQPATYTTKQVTVPMGQQTKIVYIAPDKTSQMTFQVQKADGTCVGNCSTFLTNWNSGSGSSKDTAQNISPSFNSQMKAGQQWKMTLQNAGEGFFGYLDSPSGQNLPAPIGNTPGGAQFQLMTQAEIKSQPPWLLATEEAIGTVIVLVGVGILTLGEGDVDLEVAKAVKRTAETADEYPQVYVEYTSGADSFESGSSGYSQTERIFTDSFMQGVEPYDFGNAEGVINLNAPQIVEVANTVNEEEIARADQKLKLKNILFDYGIF